MSEHLVNTLRIAQLIAHNQGRLACSPVELREDGTVTLCAAACIVFAAIQEEKGLASALEFRAELASTKSTNTNILELTFEQFGFSKLACSLIRIENDRLDPNDRLNWFINLKPQVLSPS